jgi:hypothetical protein
VAKVAARAVRSNAFVLNMARVRILGEFAERVYVGDRNKNENTALRGVSIPVLRVYVVSPVGHGTPPPLAIWASLATCLKKQVSSRSSVHRSTVMSLHSNLLQSKHEKGREKRLEFST